MGEQAALDNAILNSPYEGPGAHFVLGLGGPTGDVKDGRRPSESRVAAPAGKKVKGKKDRPAADDSVEQQGFDFDITRERREINTVINDIRARVETWWARGYNGDTPISRSVVTDR
jgi:type III restriction enzyme